jgi:hypothetical protein
LTKFRNSVGRDCPNHKEDVLRVVNKLKEIPPSNGGFKGLPSQPALAPGEGGTCDQYLIDVIARFQSLNNLNWEYKNQKGRIAVDKGMGGSTWQKMVALSGNSVAAVPAVTANIAAAAGAMSDKQAVVPTPKLATTGDLDWFVKHLTGGAKTQWTLGGTGGFGGGFGAFNVQAGSINILRPDGSELKYGLAGAGLGVSLAPGSLSYAGGDFPSGSGSIYRGNFWSCRVRQRRRTASAQASRSATSEFRMPIGELCNPASKRSSRKLSATRLWATSSPKQWNIPSRSAASGEPRSELPMPVSAFPSAPPSRRSG